MKILFCADIHIKLGQKNVPVDWANKRYSDLTLSLSDLQKGKDLFVIGGDIFDKLPNMEELEIYYDLVSSCTIPTLIYPGNHESIKKNTTFFTYLKKVTNRLNPLVTVIDNYYTHFEYNSGGPGTPIFNIIPYNKLKEYEKDPLVLNAPLLFTHVRGAIEPHVKPEVDLSIFDRWQTVLAGDLHSYENSQRNILYPGSPITTSFHRNVVDTGVIIFDTDNTTHVWHKLELPQLIRKTIQAGEEMPATDYHHTIYEVEGDMIELSAMEDNDLIDKKVVKRDSDTALILAPTMTLQEEVREYLLYILGLDESTVNNVIQTLNNNMEKIHD
jgi:DNA repair exonuclease SbcCD nuclease subunit